MASEIITVLGTEGAVQGVLTVAQKIKLISAADAREISNMSKLERNPEAIKSKRLRKLYDNQGTASIDDPNYRLTFHLYMAITNKLIATVNAMPEFQAAMKAALNTNNFISLVTKGKQIGDDATFSYYTKYPAVFQGSPKLYNKTFFATGQKGRLGFKLT
jgi:hypothetical protein